MPGTVSSRKFNAESFLVMVSSPRIMALNFKAPESGPMFYQIEMVKTRRSAVAEPGGASAAALGSAALLGAAAAASAERSAPDAHGGRARSRGGAVRRRSHGIAAARPRCISRGKGSTVPAAVRSQADARRAGRG